MGVWKIPKKKRNYKTKNSKEPTKVYGGDSPRGKGMLGYDYFSALHYPSPDRYFKMGLNWMFLN